MYCLFCTSAHYYYFSEHMLTKAHTKINSLPLRFLEYFGTTTGLGKWYCDTTMCNFGVNVQYLYILQKKTHTYKVNVIQWNLFKLYPLLTRIFVIATSDLARHNFWNICKFNLSNLNSCLLWTEQMVEWWGRIYFGRPQK